MTVQGSCLCGAVSFTIEGPPRPVVACHCGMCQRWHGNFGAYIDVASADLRLAGEDALAWYRSSSFARRGFCRHCGSSLFWHRIGSDMVSVAAGSRAAPTGLATIRHIFTADKPDWYEITDGLEQVPRPGSETP